MTIYQLYRFVKDGDEEFYCMIGNYSTEMAAAQAIERARVFWTSKSDDDRYEYFACEVDRVNWTSGFGSE